MADAVPVQSQSKEPKAPKVATPQSNVAPVEGQDHPELGTWIGNGWRKDV